MNVPPQQPQPLPRVPKSPGLGCCAGGCLTFFVVAFIGFLVLLGVGGYFLVKGLDAFTSTARAKIALEQVSDADFSAASQKVDQMRNALRMAQGGTFTFNATELNALLARHPEFASHQGKARIAIADSIASLEMSVPLSTVQLPRVKHRWFNGRASFGFIYSAENGFNFDLRSIEANGHHLNGGILSWVTTGFDRGFSRSFKDAVEKDSGGSEVWQNVKTMTLDRDQLVVITKGS